MSSEIETHPTERPRAAAIDAVVTHHRDGFRSGVARFNELLAEHLGVPLLGVLDGGAEGARCSLLSFKVSEMREDERRAVADLLERADWHGDVYLHEWTGDELERAIVGRARRVLCGNHEIADTLDGAAGDVLTVWTPGLVLDRRPYVPTELSVFSFGMAHKIQTERFRRLRDLLERSGRTYAVYVSAANHETTSIRDARVVFEEMQQIFPRLYFLGNLSDVAIHNELQRTTFFAAFFPRGVRANNTTVAAAMELGAVVITNLDRFSPPEYAHLDNLVDIEQCDELPADPLELRRIAVRAMETGRARGWDPLVDRIRT